MFYSQLFKNFGAAIQKTVASEYEQLCFDGCFQKRAVLKKLLWYDNVIFMKQMNYLYLNKYILYLQNKISPEQLDQGLGLHKEIRAKKVELLYYFR